MRITRPARCRLPCAVAGLRVVAACGGGEGAAPTPIAPAVLEPGAPYFSIGGKQLPRAPPWEPPSWPPGRAPG